MSSQDRAASDSLDPAISAMRLNVLLRRAVGLVRGLEIKQVGDLAKTARLCDGGMSQQQNHDSSCGQTVADMFSGCGTG